MVRTKIQKFRYRMGKNSYLVIKIQQTAISRIVSGNALASNAANVKVYKSRR